MEFSKPGPRGSSERERHDRPGIGAAYSALIGWSARRRVPAPLRPLAYRAFARAVGANLDETELALGAYPSFGDFFARRLVGGARTVDAAPDAIIAPCDGVVAARGIADGGSLVQAKGRHYELADLLADDALAARLEGGAYVTIYLSPRDYHRVHAPVDAALLGYDYVPGALWPVNPRVAGLRDGLLARNERVVLRLDAGPLGHVALVMVGAAGVGHIRITAHDAGGDGDDCSTLRPAQELHRVELSGVTVRRGDELGMFRLGSTVVLVFEPRAAALAAEVGHAVRFGGRIGARGERA